MRLVTSQKVTATKLSSQVNGYFVSLVTSQNVTAPKHAEIGSKKFVCLVTSQNVTAPKHVPEELVRLQFSYQSERHCAKTVVAKSPLQGDVHSN